MGSSETSSPSLMARLRAETRAEHARLERLPFAVALGAGAVSREAYREFLRAMEILQADLEELLDGSEAPWVEAVWGPEFHRLSGLRQDLEELREEEGSQDETITRALLCAVMAGEELRIRSHREPAFLLGHLYVILGSTLGGTLLRRPVAEGLELKEGRGTRYLAGWGKETRRRWVEFGRRMEAALDGLEEEPLREGAADRVVEGARVGFEAMATIVGALHPDSGPGGPAAPARARALNREAGAHAVPSDPREIRAALRAGAISWDRFPYYELRYGARGRRFTRSDSAWIVTLAGESLPVVEDQLRWLGRFLAARGMPRWLLERHLEALHGELVARCPERREAYRVFLEVVEVLQEARRAILPERQVAELADSFGSLVPSGELERIPEAGVLLVTAVLDETLGVANAVRSVEGWMKDGGRFTQEWIQGVNTLLGEVRGAVRTAVHGSP